MTTYIFRHIAHKFSWIIALFALLVSCTDERLGGGIHPETNDEGKVKVTFSLNIPGLMAPTRAEDGVDEQIETIDLFLFDEDDLLTEVVHLTKSEAEENFTENNGEYESNSGTDKNSEGEYITEESGTTGTYSAWIDGNTSRIHFIANLKEGEFDFKEHEGGSETEVIAPLITQNRVYWGRVTFDGTNLSQNPVVLYRNYAKVKVGTVKSGLTINGWTLYHRPTYGTMAPCDRDKLSGGSSSQQEELNPFDFTLGTSGVSLPIANDCLMSEHNDANQTKAETEITGSSANVAYWCFEYEPSAFEGSSHVYAIFNITQEVDGVQTPLYYKIALLYDVEWDGNENVTKRLPFTIKRNHEYTINFNGLSAKAGYKTFEEAVNHDPANNTEITIEESLPEIVSANHTLRIEETKASGSTVRYYKDYTDPATTYTIDDILVYYDGDDCTTNSSTALGVNSLQVTWQGEAPAEYVANSLSITQAKDAEGETIDHTYRVSFRMTGFADSESLFKHYTEGTLCIAEQHEKLLKRYVKVYVGPAITFRPLLISSDIPNLTNERLTILFTIPDEKYLPKDLYPIEILFGSDRVDVEKNLEVDAMKVDFGADAAQDYTGVLRWQDRDEDNEYSWTTHADNKVKNSWGYKYIHTIATPPTANEQQQRITLRTVVKAQEDFKVMMEGRSTVTGSNVFNTRELDFMMQDNGTATFNTNKGEATYGSWVVGTEATTDQLQRIMLDEGLPESRYATRYINVRGEINGATFSIPYTLGTLDGNIITPVTETDNDNAKPELWVHYDEKKFKPTSVSSGTLGTPQTDINGNTFVSITPGSTGWSKGSITFSVLDEAKNSMIFFTARNKNKYGTYNSSSFADGNVGYAYTGVNDLASTYRSAGALVSTVSKWDFNPAPSTTNGNYSFADKISIPSGKDQNLYVRIDRPSAQSTSITIDTQGALILQTAPHSVSVTNSDGSTTTTYDYTITSSGNGAYTVTLNSMESDYAYLHFKAASFNSACTIKFTGDEYNEGELIVTNAATPFLGFEYAPESELAKSEEYAPESELANSKPIYANTKDANVVPAIKGALIGVRVYLPKTLYDALNNGKDANKTKEEIFRFAFTSRNFKPVNEKSTLTTTLSTQSAYNYYSVTQSTKNNTTHIITVYEGALHDAGKSITTSDGNSYDACYIDLLLESTAIESAENVKFLGANENVTDLSFYPYNTAIACEGSYEATVEHSIDNSNWMTTPLSNIKDGTTIYYRVKMPDLGLARTNLPVLFKHNGKLAIPSGSALTDVDDEDANTFVFNISTEANAETTTTFQLEKEGNIASNMQESVIVKPAYQRIEMDSTILSMAVLQAVTPTKVEMKSARDINYVTIYENGASTNNPYLYMPRLTTNSQVYIKMTLGEAYKGQTFTLDIASVEAKGTPGLTPTNPSATVGDDGTMEFEMTTDKVGVAQIIIIKGQSQTYILPEIRQTIVSDEDDQSLYEIYWDGDGNARKGTKTANFDNNGSAYYSDTPIGDYTWCTKMDGSGLITFYAHRANMSLTIGAAKRAPTTNNGTTTTYNNPGGFLIYYNGDVNQKVNEGNYGKEELKTDTDTPTEIVEQTFALGEPGIYSIKRYSGDQFGVYYIKLQRKAASFGDFKWYATKADEEAVNKGNGTWGTADEPILATDANSDDTRDVWVSDFAQELHMTVDGLNDGETTLTISGDYKFKDGTTTQKVTPENNATSLTLVPVTYFDTNNELVNGSFTLSGTSANYSYTQKVDVNIRPWVLLTTNAGDYTTESVQTNSGNRDCSVFKLGDEAKVTFAVTDTQHSGKEVSYCVGEYGNNANLTPINVPEGWKDQKVYTTTTSSVTFTWEATSSVDRTLFQASGTSTTDVLYDGNFISTNTNEGKQSNFYNITIKANTVNYTNEGYEEGKTYSTFATQTYNSYGQTLALPNGTPTAENRVFSHWSSVSVNGNVETRTAVNNTTVVSGDMTLYPVWDVQLPSDETTVVNLMSADLAVMGNCKTTTSEYLMQYDQNDSYILFDVIPTVDGTYRFTTSIATACSTRTVTLGYLNGDTYAYSEKKDIEVTNWGVTYAKDYSWSFDLKAGKTYTFKLQTNYTEANNSTYCIDLFGIKIQKGSATSYAFNGVTTYSTASSLGSGSDYKDCYFTDQAATNNEISVKAFTNQITLQVAATGNSGSTPAISSSNYTLNNATYSDGVWTLVLDVKNLEDEDITINCEGYSNSQTASIYVRPYITTSINNTTFNGGDQIAITVNVVTVGSNKPVSFKIEDRGGLKFVDSNSFAGNGSYSLTDKTWLVDLGNLSAGTHTYTYTIYAGNTTGNNKFVVSSNSVDCYNGSDRFDASISLDYKINRVEDVYELYDADGQGSGLMTVFKNGVSTNENVIVANGFTESAVAGVNHRNSTVNVYLFDSQTGKLSTTQTELVNGSKLGGNQTVTLNIKYPSKMTIIYGHKEAGSSIKVGDETLPSPTNSNDLMTTTDYELQRGTYTISRSSGEGRLWYLRLSPYTP